MYINKLNQRDELSIKQDEIREFAICNFMKADLVRNLPLDIVTKSFEESLRIVAMMGNQTPKAEDLNFHATTIAQTIQAFPKEFVDFGIKEFKHMCTACFAGLVYPDKKPDTKPIEIISVNSKEFLRLIHYWYNGREAYHDKYIAEIRNAAIAVIPADRRLEQHSSHGDLGEGLRCDYAQYREHVLDMIKMRERAKEEGIDETKINSRHVYGSKKQHIVAGNPLWDGEGTEFEGFRCRWMNEHGFPGQNLKEVFDNMIRSGIEVF